MSRSLGSALPSELIARFSQTDLPSRLARGLPFVTLAADGTLHPMLCSYLEWLAADARTLRLAIAARSRSARNLEERGVGTLLLVEAGRTIYIKCRAMGAPLRLGELARFNLAVEDVLEDAPTAEEGDVRITGGITYAPTPALEEPWVKAVLAALRAE
jgi:hypothetical protein